MSLDAIITRWTHCYHVTAVVNLESLRLSATLLPAATLFQLSDRRDLLNCRRTRDVGLRLQDQEVLVRNQIPLDPDSIDLDLTETLGGYVAFLNAHVFFWPGTALGPTQDGMRMFRRTSGLNSAMIRVASRSLLEANDGARVRLSTCNTGASWIVNEVKSQRGPSVFQLVERFAEPPSKIEEISFLGSVHLPKDSEYCTSFDLLWQSLFEEAHDRTQIVGRRCPDEKRSDPIRSKSDPP
jgi:hypothetical protein